MALPEKIPFFNTGLLYGQSKVGAREDEASKPVYLLHNPCVAGALNPKRASSRFLAINRWDLEQVSQHRGVQLNYFVAPELGGLGLNPPPGSVITSNPDHRTKPSTVFVGSLQRKLAQYLYDRWTVDYTTPPAGPVGMPKRTNDLSLLEMCETTTLNPDELLKLSQIEEEYGLSPLGASVASPKWRYPPVEKRTVRRLVETSAFIIPGVQPVLPEVGGPKNSKLNELSDKDMLKLSYTWQMPAWRPVIHTEAKISAASACRKRFLEVKSSLEDLCIPEYLCLGR
jgi:hypothetical protein